MAWEHLRRLLQGPTPLEERPRCPICEQLVNDWPGRRAGRMGDWVPDRAELIAHYPDHGARSTTVQVRSADAGDEPLR